MSGGRNHRPRRVSYYIWKISEEDQLWQNQVTLETGWAFGAAGRVMGLCEAV